MTTSYLDHLRRGGAGALSEKALDLLGVRLCIFVPLALAFLGTWWTDPYSFGFSHDWTFFTHHATEAYDTIARYGQIPIWDPYYCGGIPALGNLQSEASSPDFLATLPFGLFVGLRVRFVLLIVLGMEGAYRYARLLASSGAGALVGAIAFALSGRFVQLFCDGQPGFFGFELLPWVVWGYARGVREPRYAMLGGAFLAWVFAHGGAIATPIVGLTTVMIVLRDLAATPLEAPGARAAHAKAVVRAFAILCVSTACLAMYRLLPVAESIVRYPRVWLGHESYSLETALGLLFAPPVHSGYVDPGTAYVGVVTACLAGVALFLHDRRALGLAVLFVAMVDISMGEGGFLGLWNVIHQLPVLHNFRNPFRFAVVGAFLVAMAAARGVTLLELAVLEAGRLPSLAGLAQRPRIARALPFVLGALSLLVAAGATKAVLEDVARANHERLERVPRRQMSPRAEGPFQQSIGNRWLSHVWPAVGLGTLSCFEEQPFFQSRALRGDLPQEEYFVRGEGTVRRLGWSPHRIDLEVTSARGGIVAVNQNAHRGFRTDVGRIVPHQGLVAIEVPPGTHRVRLVHFDPLVYGGLVVSVTSLLGMILLFLRGERRAAAERR